MPVLSLISPSSPEQLGMVSLKLCPELCTGGLTPGPLSLTMSGMDEQC